MKLATDVVLVTAYPFAQAGNEMMLPAFFMTPTHEFINLPMFAR